VPDLAGRPVLVVRADRLGDVLLSLPVLAALREGVPTSRLSFLVAPWIAPLLTGHPWLDEVLVDDRQATHHGVAGFRRLAAELRSARFAAAILLRPTLRHASLLAAARIPCRVGTAFRAYSWLFTHRVESHRRGSGRHELDLNLDLLAPFGLAAGPRLPWVPVAASARRAARALLGEGGEFVVLHPGSGGSAREWPAAHFARVGQRLRGDRGLAVAVTGTEAERELVERVAAAVPGARALAGKTSLRELAGLLAEARAVVAASTGTAHLAAAVATPVVAIYPPIRDATPVRWGVRGERVTILEAEAPPCRRCTGESCPVWDCMAAVSPETVLAALDRWLARTDRG
jgi:heptosyltransferase-2